MPFSHNSLNIFQVEIIQCLRRLHLVVSFLVLFTPAQLNHFISFHFAKPNGQIKFCPRQFKGSGYRPTRDGRGGWLLIYDLDVVCIYDLDVVCKVSKERRLDLEMEPGV